MSNTPPGPVSPILPIGANPPAPDATRGVERQNGTTFRKQLDGEMVRRAAEPDMAAKTTDAPATMAADPASLESGPALPKPGGKVAPDTLPQALAMPLASPPPRSPASDLRPASDVLNDAAGRVTERPANTGADRPVQRARSRAPAKGAATSSAPEVAPPPPLPPAPPRPPAAAIAPPLTGSKHGVAEATRSDPEHAAPAAVQQERGQISAPPPALSGAETLTSPPDPQPASTIKEPGTPAATPGTSPPAPVSTVGVAAENSLRSLPASPALPVAKSSEPASAPSPTRQIEDGLVALGPAEGAVRSLTVRLSPDALGSVQIHIDRSRDRPASVAITVERPETLTLLLRDEDHLKQALSHAGVPEEGRILTIQIKPQDEPDRPSTASRPAHADNNDLASGSGGSGADGAAGRQPRGGSHRAPRSLQQTIAARAWSRAGLDITA